ncbi:unnamed protein product [Larinioides sclopetarius]|uniref:Zonadhesin n=1 Tax=Larinioides sclopetarius TaxID=280406 RepID=A0AAV2A464_9ARAC
MEKNTSIKPIQEDLQIRDREEYQEEKGDSNDLQLNKQLQEHKEPTQNFLKQNFLQKIEENEQSCTDEELKQETDENLRQEVERSAENPLAPTQDLMQTIRLEADAVHKECDELADSNDAAQQDLYRIAKSRQLPTNTVPQQRIKLPRKLSILNSKNADLQKPCEVSEKNVKVREQNIVMQQKSTEPEKVSATPAKAGEIQYGTQDQETMQMVQELSKTLADYFSNHVMMQQRTEIPENPAQDSMPIAQHDSIDAARQEWNRIAKNEELKANAESQLRNDIPRKLSILDPKNEDLQHPCEMLEENLKVKKQGIVTQQESATLGKLSETLGEARTRYDAEDQKKMQHKQKLRRILANYFEKNQVNQQQTEICIQKNTRSVGNSKEPEPQKSKEIETYGEPEGKWNGTPGELGETLTKCQAEYEDGAHARSQESEKDATGCHRETKESKIKIERSKLSKGYVTFHKRESIKITAPRSQKIKDYVTSRRREPIGTSHFSKTKDYVTLRPRRSYIETALLKCAPTDLESKDYVTKQPIKKNTTVSAPQTPTHIFWPVRRFQENASDSGSSTQMHVPPQSLQKPPLTPESEESEPSHVPLGTQQLETEKTSPALASTTLPLQAQLLQNQSPRPTPKDDFRLVPLEEVCSETTIEANEPEVQRNGRILGIPMPPLPTGIQDLVQRFCERHIPAEREASLKTLITVYVVFVGGLLVGSSISAALFFSIPFLINKLDIGGSNVTSHHNLNISATDLKHYYQNKSLYGKVNTPMTHLVDSNVNFTTTMADFDVNITNSLADLDTEIISMTNYLNDNVNTPEIDSDSTVTTLATNLDVKLIDLDFGVTTYVYDFDINASIPVTNLDINTINPVAELDSSITIPVTELNANFTTCATI